MRSPFLCRPSFLPSFLPCLFLRSFRSFPLAWVSLFFHVLQSRFVLLKYAHHAHTGTNPVPCPAEESLETHKRMGRLGRGIESLQQWVAAEGAAQIALPAVQWAGGRGEGDGERGVGGSAWSVPAGLAGFASPLPGSHNTLWPAGVESDATAHNCKARRIYTYSAYLTRRRTCE